MIKSKNIFLGSLCEVRWRLPFVLLVSGHLETVNDLAVFSFIDLFKITRENCKLLNAKRVLSVLSV